eukprot:COSAG01_NODE_35670_length_528_cov_1.512821_2_plen_52_part_01
MRTGWLLPAGPGSMSFFSCDWILLIFLISRLQAEWPRAATHRSPIGMALPVD